MVHPYYEYCNILEGKQNVTCNFEDTFICGYTTSTAGTISWERVSGRILSRSTEDEHGKLRVRVVLICELMKYFMTFVLYPPKLKEK